MLERVPLGSHNYEAGKNRPDFDGLIALADYFDVSLDYLVGRSDAGSATRRGGFMAARGRPQGSPLRRYALGRVPRLSPFRVGGRRPKAASLAPLGQFTFCPHRPALCRAGASSI